MFYFSLVFFTLIPFFHLIIFFKRVLQIVQQEINDIPGEILVFKILSQISNRQEVRGGDGLSHLLRVLVKNNSSFERFIFKSP